MKQLKLTKGQKKTSAVENAEVSYLQDGDHYIINALCILTMQQTGLGQIRPGYAHGFTLMYYALLFCMHARSTQVAVLDRGS